jgi:hypothetical protein
MLGLQISDPTFNCEIIGRYVGMRFRWLAVISDSGTEK